MTKLKDLKAKGVIVKIFTLLILFILLVVGMNAHFQSQGFWIQCYTNSPIGPITNNTNVPEAFTIQAPSTPSTPSTPWTTTTTTTPSPSSTATSSTPTSTTASLEKATGKKVCPRHAQEFEQVFNILATVSFFVSFTFVLFFLAKDMFRDKMLNLWMHIIVGMLVFTAGIFLTIASTAVADYAEDEYEQAYYSHKIAAGIMAIINGLLYVGTGLINPRI